MTKKVLLVSDRLNPEQPEKGLVTSGEEISLLTLGFGASLYKNTTRAVAVSPLAESSAQSVREFITAFIYEFPKKKIFPGQRSLLDILRHKDINFWWFNKMSEKGALWSMLIKRLFFFDLIITECASGKYDELWIEVEDGELVELIERNRGNLPRLRIRPRRRKTIGNKIRYFVALFVNNMRVLFSSALKTLIVKKLFRKAAAGKERPSTAFFSFYPLFWSRDGKKESFFGSSPQSVSREMPSVYLTWFSMGARQLFKKRKCYFDANIIPERVPLEAFLGIKDYLNVFYALVSYFLKSLIIFFRSGKIKADYKGFDISGIAADEFFSGLSGQETAMCLLINKAFDNYCSRNPLKSVVFRAEFQPHEKALVYASKGRCISVAFQHQAIGRNFIQYFFPKEEISGSYSNPRNPDVQPLADKYLVAATYPYEVLMESGFKKEDVRIAGPVRYSGLVKYLRTKKSRQELRSKYGYGQAEKVILVTPPAAKGEVLNFAATLAKAAESGGDYKYLFKSHPVFNFNDEIEKVIKEHCPAMDRQYLKDSVNLNEYLTLADCLVLSGTTVGIEAICLGTMPVLLDNPNIFSLNPLTEIKDALFWVSDHDSLRAAIVSAIADDERCRAIKVNWGRAIEKIFYNIDEDPDERFCAILKEWLH